MSAAISETTMRLAMSTMALLATGNIADGRWEPFVCLNGHLVGKPAAWVGLKRSDFETWCSQIAQRRK